MKENPLLQLLFEEVELRPLTVSELNSEVRTLLERKFTNVWVEGEIVNFMAAASGHWYFNLNDGTTQLKCVCWKGTNYRVRFRPQNGNKVRIRGKITFWEAKGELKLTVDSLEPSGEGALRAAYDQIKATLEAEGLFAPELKRQIPYFPRKVGIVTSPTGAAYFDIHNVLTRRAGSVCIVLVPTIVQGETAADSIRQAVIDVNIYNRGLATDEKIDVLIVGRGGGSAEDLWAFNDELLARTLRMSEIPVISAVGHEIDWTIADLIADVRAATPSAAAEIVAGREEDLLNGLIAREQKLARMMDYLILESNAYVSELTSRMREAFAGQYRTATTLFSKISSRITPQSLLSKVTVSRHKLSVQSQRQETAVERNLKAKQERFALNVAKLDALSPLSVMHRGFSITQSDDGRILRDPAEVRAGDKLKILLEKGKLNAEVLAED